MSNLAPRLAWAGRRDHAVRRGSAAQPDRGFVESSLTGVAYGPDSDETQIARSQTSPASQAESLSLAPRRQRNIRRKGWAEMGTTLTRWPTAPTW